MDTGLAFVSHPQFMGLVLGTLVPFVYNVLTEGGVAIPARLRVWLNLVLSTTVAFIPVLARWWLQGLPTDPEVALAGITSAVLGSELAYRTWFKKAELGAACAGRKERPKAIRPQRRPRGPG